MYTLFNNIISDIFYYVVVCVDFLGTHMMSLVFFEKLGATDVNGRYAYGYCLLECLFTSITLYFGTNFELSIHKYITNKSLRFRVTSK